MDKRLTPEQKVIEHANSRTQAWIDAAERAEIRGDHMTAIFFKNIAWKIETGKNWLDDVVVKP